MQYLLEHEADVNAVDVNGDTPMHLLCNDVSSYSDMPQAIRILVSNISPVYTRVLTRVKLTSGCKPRVPIHQWMWVESTSGLGVFITGGESGLNPG